MEKFVIAVSMFKEGERNVVWVLKGCEKDKQKQKEDEEEVIVISDSEDKEEVIVIADSGDEDERQGNGNSWQGEFLKFLELREKVMVKCKVKGLAVVS